jgi:hypothetical protein
MSNLLLAWDNAVLNSFNLYADGWWTFDASAANLGIESLSMKWVTPGLSAAATRLTCGFNIPSPYSNQSVVLVALCNHNLSTSATVRVRASNYTDFVTDGPLYDSGNLAAYPAAAVSAGAAVLPGLRRNWILKLPSTVSAQYWRFEIIDGSNPDGVVTVGRIFAATRLWQPSINMLYGASIGWEDNSSAAVALNGAEWFTNVSGCRVAKFQLEPMPTTEMMANVFELQRCAATGRREVIFQYDPADTTEAVRRSMLGRLRQLSALEEPYYSRLKAAFEIKELL